MAIHIPGLIAIIVFYLIILVIGIWAARKAGLRATGLRIDDVMLANRSIGLVLGFFTMTATWVGGGYINGSTEKVAKSGLVWCQAPVTYSLSLLLGGLFFAERMRNSGFTTMLDPFHWKYGDLMSCLLYIPSLTGDVFWSASILSALGATLKVILDIDLNTAIIVSAAIALVYTILGGLYSVAYTDVIQLICIFVGLWLCVPFAMTHEATVSIATNNSVHWLGTVEPSHAGYYIDLALLSIFGGIPWQVYWQRALSAKTAFVAKTLSCLASIGCIVMVIPAILLGAVASSTDWNQTEYGHPTILKEDSTLTLPLVMRHLCPPAVTFIGLGAVSAAVMSSTDSSILSSSCMFSRNVFSVIHTRIWGKNPSETMQVWVMRLAQIVVATMACAMAIGVKSIYYLFLLCSDFVYVILFPQLVCVMFHKKTNSYGSFTSFVLGLFFRLMGGEVMLRIPPTIIYPLYQEESETQLFPFRTLSMLISLFSHVAFSCLADFLFTRNILPLSLDVFQCFQEETKKELMTSPDLPKVKVTLITTEKTANEDDTCKRRFNHEKENLLIEEPSQTVI